MNVAGSFILLGLTLISASVANAQVTPQAVQVEADSQVPKTLINDVTSYTIVPRHPELTFYPCSQCHKFLPKNSTQRELFSPHPSTLTHSNGRFWCLTCHNEDDRDYLRRVDGALLGF